MGLNFADLAACLGLYSATPAGAFVPGLEFAGTVEAVGEGPKPRTRRPSHRTYPIRRLCHARQRGRTIPASPSGQLEHRRWRGAAREAITAGDAISELGACKRGDAVLVQSAAGGVGLNALAILQGMGARVVATVGQEGKVAFLITHAGLDRRHIIVRDRRAFGPQLDEALRANGMDGFHLVLDAVAGPFFERRTGGSGRRDAWWCMARPT